MRNSVEVAELLKLPLALAHPPARRFDLDETDRQALIENHQIRAAGEAEADETVFLPDGAGVEPFAADALPGEPVHDGFQGGCFPADVAARNGPVPGRRVEPLDVVKKYGGH